MPIWQYSVECEFGIDNIIHKLVKHCYLKSKIEKNKENVNFFLGKVAIL